MSQQKTVKQQGFTIIEVVLVLAIAGLIFLMVFIALPALQRSQRDTQRRSDASTFISQLTSYSTNNRGKIPATDEVTTFAADYLNWKADETGEFNDPQTGEGYNLREGLSGAAPSINDGDMFYAAGAKCDGEESVSSTNTREAAVVVKLEGSGKFCQSNL